MTNETTVIDEPTVEAVAAEFVKDHNSQEIVEELVKYSNEVDRLKENLDYQRRRDSQYSDKIEKVKKFIVEHISDNEEASIEELKQLAYDLDIELTKRVNVSFTVEYNLTIECDINDEIDETDFTLNLDYSGSGEVIDESPEWSSVEIEDED
jgi:hypothetical protein